MGPLRSVLLTALALISLALSGCPDAVSQARGGSHPAPTAPVPLQTPADLDLSAERQTCETASDCVVVHGVPGQSLQNLCCTGCDTRTTVLNTRYAARLSTYKEQIGCAHALCPPRGDCPIELVTAECTAGKCRRVSAP